MTVLSLAEPPAPGVVLDRLQALMGLVESHSEGRLVTVVAVTKGFSSRAVRMALEMGLTDIGENYSQELLQKASELSSEAVVGAARWHFLGAVQRRRVKSLAPTVTFWQGLARDKEAIEVAKWQPGAQVLVEVNVTGDPRRNGAAPRDVDRLVDQGRTAGLEVRGLMVVAPQGTAEEVRSCFASVARMAQRLQLPELSMGMTGDLEIALQQGATMVRVGRALFGPRPSR